MHDFCQTNKKSSWYQKKNGDHEMYKEFACQLLSLDIIRSSCKDSVNKDKLKNLFAWSNTRRMNGKQSGKKFKQFRDFIDNNKMEETYVLLLIFFVSNSYNICKRHKLFLNCTNDNQIGSSNNNNNNSEEEKEIKVKFFSAVLEWTLKQKTKEGGQRRIFQEAKGLNKSKVFQKLQKMFLNNDTPFNVKQSCCLLFVFNEFKRFACT